MKLLVFLVLPLTVVGWSGLLINRGSDTQIWEPTTAAQQYVNFNLTQGYTESAVKLGGKAYFLGAATAHGWESTVVMFDPKTNKTTSAPPTTATYTDFGIVAATIPTQNGDTILICGIITGGNACEMLVKGKWMPVPAPGNGGLGKTMTTMTVVDGKAWIIGGFVDSLTFVFDAKTMTWTQKSNAPVSLSAHASVALDSTTILTCGGTNFTTPPGYSGILPNDRQCMTYNTAKDTWSGVLPQQHWLNVARAYFTMIKYAGRIYALGGENIRDAFINVVEIYDMKTATWQISPFPLPVAEGSFAAVPIINSM